MARTPRWSDRNHEAWTAREASDAVRPALKLEHTEIPEAVVLKQVLAALLRHPKVASAWRVNSGAGHLVYRNGGASQFIRFGFPGCPDIHGVMNHGGRALFVECKRAGGKPTDDQAAFLERMRRAGAVAFIAYGVDDVHRELA